jgi:hypothetical protein
MKKIRFYLASLVAVLSIGFMSSCDKGDSTNNGGVNSQIKSSKLEDNETTQMVYNEYLKTFPELTYEDFRLNGSFSKTIMSEKNVQYYYKSSQDKSLTIHLDMVNLI